MPHPVLEDPALSVPVQVVRANGTTVSTRGIVKDGYVEDATTGLAAPHGREIMIPDPTGVGEDYGDNEIVSVSVPSLGPGAYRVVEVQPQGTALGSTAIGWRSVLLRVQRQDEE